MSLRGLVVNKLGWLMTFEEPSETLTSGDATVVWTVRGEAKLLSEWLSGADATGLVAEQAYRFIGEVPSGITITSRWRLGKKGTPRKFQIVAGPGDPAGRGRQMVIMATEVQA